MALAAGSAYSDYSLNLKPLTASIAAAKSQLAAFKAFADKTLSSASAGAAGGASGGAASGGAAAASRNAANDALSLAQARARLAVASGDAAKAESILGSALASSTGASEKAIIATQTQAARLASGKTLVTEFGSAAKSSLLGIIGPAALVTASIGAVGAAVQKTEEAFKFKAQIDETNRSITTLIGTTRNSAAVFAQAAQFADRYKLTQQETNDILASSVDILRTSAAGVGELEANLLRLQSRDVSKPISEAARALRELQAGDTTSIKELFNVPAAEANRMKQEILAGGDAVRVLGQYLDRAGIGMGVLENRTKGASGLMRDLAVQGEKFSLALGGQAGGAGEGFLQFRINALKELTALLSGDYSQIEARNAARIAGEQAYQTALQAGKTEAEAYAAAQERMQQVEAAGSVAALNNANAQSHLASEHLNGAAAVSYNSAAMAENAAVQSHLSSEHLAGGSAAAIYAQQARDAATASLTDAAAKEEESLKLQLAQAQAEQAASAFLALHPNISASGVASLVAAGQMDPLIAQLIQARIRATEAANALLLFNLQAGAKGQNVIGRAAADDLKQEQLAFRTSKQRATAAKNYNDLLDAQRDRINTIGTASERVTQAENDLAAARKRYGASSDEAYRAETALMQARQRAAKEGTKGGAAKVSEAAKFNNQILDNEAKTQQKLEDLARTHYQNELKIQADFEKKSLEQQKANEIDKRRSRASFYKTLNVDNRDLSQQVRDQLSAAYEAAYAKAQELAAAGNAQQANEYLKLKQSQLEAEAQFQRDLAEAKKSGDKAAVEALIQARELERQAEAEEEKQLLEGGDANVNAKNEALSEEQKRYEDAQAGAVEASDRATDKIVTNADRRGVALDAENKKLREQADLYNQMAGTGPLPPGVSVTTPPPTAPAPAGGAAAGVPGAPPVGGAEVWRVFDQGVIDAINNQTAVLGGKLDGVIVTLGDVGKRVSAVESAVRGIGSRALQ